MSNNPLKFLLVIAVCNLAKALLYCINGGIDEIKRELVIPGFDKMEDEVLDYEKVKNTYWMLFKYVIENLKLFMQ